MPDMAQVDINHAPPGGFQYGAWYWNPSVGQAQRYSGNGQFLPVGQTELSGNNNNTATSGPLAQINQTIQDSFQKLQNEATDKFKQYTAANPFSYDQVLANKTKSAKEQIDPYYNQLLGDYMDGVQRKLDRGFNDTQDLLGELSAQTKTYTTASANNAANATEQSQQQYADAGLNGSGAALRSEGQIQQSTNAGMQDYLRKQDLQQKQATQNLQRNVQDTNAAKTDYVTNLEQNRNTDIATRAGQLAKEQGQQYIQGFQSTLPTQLQSASGFDMLKSLGIYS